MTRHPSYESGSLLLLVAAIALLPPAAHAQMKHEGPTKLIALSETTSPYDVVSIKQNNSGADSGDFSFHADALTIRNMPLENILEFAFDVQADRMTGLTGSLKDQHFDIDAKLLPPDGDKPTSTTASQDQGRVILLLQDRLHLKVHVETKTMPVYDLVVAKGGPKIKLSQDEIKNNSWNLNGQDASFILTSKDASMTDLADALSDEVHRQVIDKTGLTGHADITLKWSDDVAVQQGGPNVISIFTAIQDQLGLKLESSKGPVETLVVDHIEMPTAN